MRLRQYQRHGCLPCFQNLVYGPVFSPQLCCIKWDVIMGPNCVLSQEWKSIKLNSYLLKTWAYMGWVKYRTVVTQGLLYLTGLMLLFHTQIRTTKKTQQLLRLLCNVATFKQTIKHSNDLSSRECIIFFLALMDLIIIASLLCSTLSLWLWHFQMDKNTIIWTYFVYNGVVYVHCSISVDYHIIHLSPVNWHKSMVINEWKHL